MGMSHLAPRVYRRGRSSRLVRYRRADITILDRATIFEFLVVASATKERPQALGLAKGRLVIATVASLGVVGITAYTSSPATRQGARPTRPA